MNCLECRNLTRALELTQTKHVEALAAAFYRVSTEIAAKREVDMERAASDLYEHQLTCPLAPAQPTVRPASA
jgi:hypothetical protein